jgi:hypothetical protein
MAKKIIYNITAKQRKIGTLTHAFASIYPFTGTSQGCGDSQNKTHYIC